MHLQISGMGRDGGLWLERSMEIYTGPLQGILRARAEDMQTQGWASKPYWPRGKGVHGDKPLLTFQDHLQAVLPELFLRRPEVQIKPNAIMPRSSAQPRPDGYPSRPG